MSLFTRSDTFRCKINLSHVNDSSQFVLRHTEHAHSFTHAHGQTMRPFIPVLSLSLLSLSLSPLVVLSPYKQTRRSKALHTPSLSPRSPSDLDLLQLLLFLQSFRSSRICTVIFSLVPINHVGVASNMPLLRTAALF